MKKNEPHHYTLSELVCNKNEISFRISIRDTDNPNTPYDMGRRYSGTVWLRIPTTSDIGLYPIWNRFNRTTSPCERHDIICQLVEEEIV